jgi:hypothetical protein
MERSETKGPTGVYGRENPKGERGYGMKIGEAEYPENPERHNQVGGCTLKRTLAERWRVKDVRMSGGPGSG